MRRRVTAAGVVVRNVAELVPQDPRYRADAGYVVLVANSVRQQPVADFPRENARILLLELPNVGDHLGGCDAGFRSTDGAREDRSGFVVAC